MLPKLSPLYEKGVIIVFTVFTNVIGTLYVLHLFLFAKLQIIIMHIMQRRKLKFRRVKCFKIFQLVIGKSHSNPTLPFSKAQGFLFVCFTKTHENISKIPSNPSLSPK